ncbi:urokinase plasminogen activator surface receptor-like [Brachyhypopomus gauderio]|uniref:urokinase plasminogen activator surface receptor-like n=1 Tax=Brachyhypopomus gauderio TaxID=698409 RepID=UPI0040425A99
MRELAEEAEKGSFWLWLRRRGGAPLVDLQLKSCAAPAECINGSLNLGLVRTVLGTKCCKTDLCNSQTVSALPEPPNGKRCYTCDGHTCSRTLKCEGDENLCISASANVGGMEVALKGCATKSFCDGISSVQQTISMTKMSCCVGNLCNSGNMVNLRFFLMLGPLLPSFFH